MLLTEKYSAAPLHLLGQRQFRKNFKSAPPKRDKKMKHTSVLLKCSTGRVPDKVQHRKSSR